MQNRIYLTASEIQDLLGVSRAKAYRIVKDLNEELAAKNYIVIPGRIPRKFSAKNTMDFRKAQFKLSQNL